MDKPVRPWAVILKGGLLFLLVNLLFVLPWSRHLGSWTPYNHLVPGLPRFSGTTDLDALFSSHLVSQPKQPDEFRVLVIGDSSVWGVFLDYDQTVTGLLTAANLQTCDGKRIVAYDLGMGFKSLLKDLTMLDRGLQHQPDLIIWSLTLETLTDKLQLEPPFIQVNPALVDTLNRKYALGLEIASPSLFDRTLIGQRSRLADLADVQLSALAWGATGIDQPRRAFDRPSNNLANDANFNGWAGPTFDESLLRFDLFDAVLRAAGDIPVIVVNEPIFIGNGKNSDIRYNANYPRWAFDQYRQIMLRRSQPAGWTYLDLWNLVPGKNFTNSTFHRDPQGEKMVFRQLAPAVQKLACP